MIKQHAGYAIRKMMYDALYGKVTVSSDLIPVYDNITTDTPQPFIKIGASQWQISSNAVTNKDGLSDNISLNIQIETLYGGSMLCSQIIGEVVKVISTADQNGTLCIAPPFKIMEFEQTLWNQISAIDREVEIGNVEYGFRITQS